MDENTSLNEFMEAFGGEDGNQTDGARENASVEEETAAQEPAAEDGTAAEGQTTAETEVETGNEAQNESAQQAQESETFTLKVNKEEKTYSREEVISLAQKGADYDRVKDQLTQVRQEREQLQGQIANQQEAMEVLEELAKESGTDLQGLLKDLRIGLLKKQGLSDDAANERLLRLAAEKENASLKAAATTEGQQEETGDQRARRELAELREVYPEVELSKELLEALMPDVQGGMSLLKAYQKYEGAQKDAQIAELQRQLAAEKQNKANLAGSPGSQKDSGGKRTKSDFDEFMEAFQ